MRKNKPMKGFTLIELSLSMVFISLLSLAVVLIIMNTVSAYRRGLTMNQVNSLGQEIIDDIRVTIQNSPAVSIENQCSARYPDEADRTDRDRCESSHAAYLVSINRSQAIKIATENSSINVPVFGAICIGSYSYIWNSGYAFSNDVSTEGGAVAKAKLIITDGNSTVNSFADFRLIKVTDQHRTICSQHIKDYPEGTPTVGADFKITNQETGGEEPVLLIDNESDFAIYSLEMYAPAESNDGTSLFYSGSMILGTIRGGPSIKSGDSSCKTPDSAISDFDYCAINKFKFAARAGNGV